TIILFFTVLTVSSVQAQRTTQIGLTGGAVRFYPEAQHLGSNLNNRMDNGWGWSAGVFFEELWKPKIHQIIELNYYSLSSDVFLQKNPTGPWGPYDGTGRQPIYGDFKNTSFSQLSISGGIKYFLNKKLFVYPGFEIARSLNPKVDINKTTYYAKMGFGVNFKVIDIMLEYGYGLKFQRIIYDPTVPFAITHRNTYLQLKIQVPLYRLR
ncbi:MAG: hypothetical protein J7L95_04780, partial [Prolixibacteraceae bacterium]|nr:hypothetical protein [Prolixibacteraceae bacterium]